MSRARGLHIDDKLSARNGEVSTAFIQLHQVVKTFKNAAGEFTVLKGINANFDQSEFVSVVGRSGSGKSTLLNMMTGIDHPTTGSVRVGEIYLHTLSEGKMSVWRGKSMGIVFQFFQLLPMLTLLENVMLPMDFCEMYAPAERETRAMQLLNEVDLHGFEHKYPAAVSGGQQQSAAVARALANDPPILVADEPTGNLDTRTAELILSIFEQQVTRGKTVIMVTHDNTLAQRAARKLVITDGELVDEKVSKAFADLPHSLLLTMSKQAEPMTFAPGADVLQQCPGAGLFIVSTGEIAVLKNSRSGPVVVNTLTTGDFYSPQYSPKPGGEKQGVFGIRAREADLILRAGNSPVEAMVISDTALRTLMTGPAGDGEALLQTLQGVLPQEDSPSQGRETP